MKKLSKIQENINLLKQKMAANAKGKALENRVYKNESPLFIFILEYDEKHAGLKQNKETLDNHFRSLKKGMNKSRDQDREKLTKVGFRIDLNSARVYLGASLWKPCKANFGKRSMHQKVWKGAESRCWHSQGKE